MTMAPNLYGPPRQVFLTVAVGDPKKFALAPHSVVQILLDTSSGSLSIWSGLEKLLLDFRKHFGSPSFRLRNLLTEIGQFTKLEVLSLVGFFTLH